MISMIMHKKLKLTEVRSKMKRNKKGTYRAFWIVSVNRSLFNMGRGLGRYW
uniref:Uncharacterized protein n=1 Tax=Anguilla anguilla TaxID=7936 RepID=A0A0E9TKX6_ANGAN